MLKFDVGNDCVNVRSVAVIIDGNRVLLQRAQGDCFWALPGGRVELFEHADATVLRELAEEIGALAHIVRHLWHVDNFFEYAGKRYHEIANYFLVTLAEGSGLLDCDRFNGIESEVSLEFRWCQLDDVADVDIRPYFLRDSLQELPRTTQYVKINEFNQ